MNSKSLYNWPMDLELNEFCSLVEELTVEKQEDRARVMIYLRERAREETVTRISAEAQLSVLLQCASAVVHQIDSQSQGSFPELECLRRVIIHTASSVPTSSSADPLPIPAESGPSGPMKLP